MAHLPALRRSDSPGFRGAFLVAYGLGALLCVGGPLLTEVARLRPAPPITGWPAEELGYTFTGLLILGALFMARRSRRVLAGFAALSAGRRHRVMATEILLYAAVSASSVLMGLACFRLGGPQAGRYGHTFVTLAPVMFLVFVPRLDAWRKAAEPPCYPDRELRSGTCPHSDGGNPDAAEAHRPHPGS